MKKRDNIEKLFGNKLITFSQNMEDIILHGYFYNEIEPGFYVDVGANHPVEDSVTKFFYVRGWTGINIEPIPHVFELIKEDRPRDTNLCIGISEKEGRAHINVYENHGTSTLSGDLSDSYAKRGISGTKVRIKLMRLDNLLEKYAKGKVINFMKIDVEGLETQVIKSNNWRTFRPKVVCVESTGRDTDWKNILKKAGYQLHIFDGLNEFYVAKEWKELISSYKRFVASETIRNDIATMPLLKLRNTAIQKLHSLKG